jgi:hypothetical protein
MSNNQELQDRAQNTVNRAKAIITKPSETWAVIAGETDAPMQVFMRYAVPLAAIGPVASFIGGQVFGYGAFGLNYRPGMMEGLGQAIASYVLTLLSLWLLAWVANFLSPKFSGRDDFAAAFRLVAYAMTAAWVVGIVGLIPALGVLGLAGLYSLFLFYRGAHPIMGVPTEQSMAYTAITVVVAVIANIVIGLITAAFAGSMALGGLAGAADKTSADNMTLDLGDLGKITIDGNNQTIDMGDLGKITVDETTGETTVTVEDKRATITQPEE